VCLDDEGYVGNRDGSGSDRAVSAREPGSGGSREGVWLCAVLRYGLLLGPTDP
jgi:hypothetical protein